jgi:outer membrane protein OmpA-like peptidoglycan-associated protein
MEFEENERDVLPLVAIVVLVLLAVVGGLWWLVSGGEESSVIDPKATSPPSPTVEKPVPPTLAGGAEDSSEDVLANLDVKVKSADPAEVAATIAKLLAEGNFQSASRALGGNNGEGISPEALQALRQRKNEKSLTMPKVREVGELETNRRKRFALEWEKGGPSPLFLDLVRGEDGQWSVAEARVPAGDAAADANQKPAHQENPVAPLRDPAADSLTVSDAFLQATLSQDFVRAKSHVANSGVSDAKNAALCIIFEEGHYDLNPSKPLKVLFSREETAAYLANVLTGENGQSAQFGLNLTRKSPEAPWKVSEINLDALLADYADRVADGDLYYTPLVPNPKGGDTLVIYFGFDEETLAPRTQRQLKIVSEVLRTDPDRQLTISGHTDALGSDAYNRELSRQRARTVRSYLVAQGVKGKQIIIQAEGESRPRRPNETESGADNPEGRRANRRTEIYLDF